MPFEISNDPSLTGGSKWPPGEETFVNASSRWHLAMKAVVLWGAGGGPLGLWVFLRFRFLPQKVPGLRPSCLQLDAKFAVRLLGRSPGRVWSSFQLLCSRGESMNIRVLTSTRASGVQLACRLS
jgi:hypothetical protein